MKQFPQWWQENKLQIEFLSRFFLVPKKIRRVLATLIATIDTYLQWHDLNGSLAGDELAKMEVIETTEKNA